MKRFASIENSTLGCASSRDDPGNKRDVWCCDSFAYRMRIATQLPGGYYAFMVVPVTIYDNEMPAGPISSYIEDIATGSSYAHAVAPQEGLSYTIPYYAIVYYSLI